MQTNLKVRAMSRVNVIAMEGVMGQIDRSPTDYIMPPRKLSERLTAVANGEAGETGEEPTASLMAQRFAPEAAANDAIPVSDAPQVEPLRARARSAAELDPAEPRRFATPAIVAGLIITTILSGVAAGVVAWKSGMKLPVSFTIIHRDSPQMEASTVSHALETVLPKQDVLIPRVALTAPISLDATAGQEVPFALTLDSAEPLPSRSTLVISGLADAMSLSAGRPFGQTEWSLTPGEIGELSLSVPANASGQHDLSVTLLTADGTEIAHAATHLLVANATNALVSRPDEKGRIDELIAHGRKMIDVGYFAGARAYYRRAAEAGSGEASFALAATYDPALIEEMGAQGIKPDIGEARTWYDRARKLGVKEADAELARLDALPAAAPQPQAGVVLPPPQPTSAEDGNPDWVEMSGSANLRESPSVKSPALKVVQRGTRVLAVGRQGSWVHITDPATKDDGWVYQRYLDTFAQ
ncbi:MAG TPA: SH3 domain-containing protein [Methyloceanibacter sp.]